MSWTTITDISPIAWYKADAITGLSDGDPIDTWPDSSGNGRDLTQTSTARPLYKTGIVNSLPVARFDGSNDFMSSGSFTLSSSVCVCIVHKLAVNKNFNSFVCIDDNATPVFPVQYLQAYYSTSFFAHRHAPPGDTYVTYATTGQTSSFEIITYNQPHRVSGNRILATFDGDWTTPVSAISGNATPATGTAYIHLGYGGIGGDYLNGDVAEVVVYEETANRESIWLEGYFANKYGITLESGHLFKNAAPTSAPPTYNSLYNQIAHPLGFGG